MILIIGHFADQIILRKEAYMNMKTGFVSIQFLLSAPPRAFSWLRDKSLYRRLKQSLSFSPAAGVLHPAVFLLSR